jgi:sarcosine oxidase
MSSSHYDVIVAGVGAMGSAACWHLAKRGLKVLGLERFDLGHAMGSSHGLTRIIRLAYFEGSHYVPIVKRAHQLWQETGDAAGLKLLHVTGSLDLAPEGLGPVESSLQSCLDHDLEHDMLGRDEIMRRFPAFHVPDGYLGLWQPGGGFVASEKAIYAHVGLAQSKGADIRTGEPMLDWQPTADGGVTVRTERTTYSAGRLVITSGGWITDAVPQLSRSMTTVRQAIGWFTTRRPELFREGAFPVFILSAEEGTFYGFPLYETSRLQARRPAFRARADGSARAGPDAEPQPGQADPRMPGALPSRRQWRPADGEGLRLHGLARRGLRYRRRARRAAGGVRLGLLRPRLQIRQRDRRDPGGSRHHRPLRLRSLALLPFPLRRLNRRSAATPCRLAEIGRADGARSPTGPALATAAQNRRGIIAMLAAMTLFCCNDALMKLARRGLPGRPGAGAAHHLRRRGKLGAGRVHGRLAQASALD